MPTMLCSGLHEIIVNRCFGFRSQLALVRMRRSYARSGPSVGETSQIGSMSCGEFGMMPIIWPTTPMLAMTYSLSLMKLPTSSANYRLVLTDPASAIG